MDERETSSTPSELATHLARRVVTSSGQNNYNAVSLNYKIVG